MSQSPIACENLRGSIESVVIALCASLGLPDTKALSDLATTKRGNGQCLRVVELPSESANALGASRAFRLHVQGKGIHTLFVTCYVDPRTSMQIAYAGFRTVESVTIPPGVLNSEVYPRGNDLTGRVAPLPVSDTFYARR